MTCGQPRRLMSTLNSTTSTSGPDRTGAIIPKVLHQGIILLTLLRFLVTTLVISQSFSKS
jgi:hypothetical protein